MPGLRTCSGVCGTVRYVTGKTTGPGWDCTGRGCPAGECGLVDGGRRPVMDIDCGLGREGRGCGRGGESARCVSLLTPSAVCQRGHTVFLPAPHSPHPSPTIKIPSVDLNRNSPSNGYLPGRRESAASDLCVRTRSVSTRMVFSQSNRGPLTLEHLGNVVVEGVGVM